MMAGDHGLQHDISLSGTPVAHAQLVQLNQSDADFLLDRVLALGAAMWVDGSTLIVTDHAPDATPDTLTYGETLESFDVRADLRRQRTVIGVTGWDLRTRQVITAAASEASLPPEDPGGGRAAGGPSKPPSDAPWRPSSTPRRWTRPKPRDWRAHTTAPGPSIS